MSSPIQLDGLRSLFVRQRRELGELFGFETRNKYSIETDTGQAIAFAAEQQKGILGFLARQFLGHYRSFDIVFFGPDRQPLLRASHPFRFFFQRLDLATHEGQMLGSVQQRFSILSKKFDVLNSNGNLLMTVSSPFWRMWTFVFERHGNEVARVEKKWSGFLNELFTDKDTFRIQMSDPSLSDEEKLLLIAASMFIDLQYFERKANSNA